VNTPKTPYEAQDIYDRAVDFFKNIDPHIPEDRRPEKFLEYLTTGQTIYVHQEENL